MNRALLFVCLSLCGQTVSFEVASVKPAAPSASRRRTVINGGRVSFPSTTLSNVLLQAYALKAYQVAGPSWIFSERYDIEAKAPENTSKERVLLMLQALLVERFELKLHREPREMPVYLLVTGKGTPKYQKSEGDVGYDMSRGKRVLQNFTMAQLADMLAPTLQRPVFDRTDLGGTYNIPLEMSFEELGGINAKSEVTAPSIFTIIEGLGLKLESTKAPVEVIVVDKGNKVPKEN